MASDRIVVELTEHSDVADYPLLHLALARLRVLDVKIAIDDTSSGFASLSHILNLRPDIIKLDLELVRGIHLDPARRALATGLLAFAQQIGAALVAEGMETEHELSALRGIGVTHGQGYFLGRPAPPPWPLTSPAYGELALGLSPRAPSRAARTRALERGTARSDDHCAKSPAPACFWAIQRYYIAVVNDAE